jgi:hypothetical protein
VTLEEMNKNLNALIEHKCVIEIAGAVITGAAEADR